MKGHCASPGVVSGATHQRVGLAWGAANQNRQATRPIGDVIEKGVKDTVRFRSTQFKLEGLCTCLGPLIRVSDHQLLDRDPTGATA